jgi:hypothetical protein
LEKIHWNADDKEDPIYLGKVGKSTVPYRNIW